MKLNRFFYLFLALTVMCLGLLSRRMTDYIPDIIDLFLGDILWALMIYFLIRFTFRNLSVKNSAIISILFCFTVEFSQLYHSPWIDNIRTTAIGGLVLGYGFLWSDLVSYIIGIGLGILIETIMLKM